MERLIECDRCRAPLAEVPDRSVVQTVCATCRFKFQVINGPLANKSGRQVGSHQRDYELRLEIGDRQLEIVRFRIARDHLPARPGDEIVVVHTMRGKQLEELLYVRNLTTGDIIRVGSPGDRAERSANALGFLVAAVSIGVAMTIEQYRLVALGGAAVISYVAWLWIDRRLEPKHQLSPEFAESRQATQGLLERKQACDAGRLAAVQSLAENEAHRERLIALRRKMSDVDIDLFKPRLDAIDRGLMTLDRQRAVDIALRDGYERAVKILDIELEAGAAAEQLGGDVAPLLLSKLDELRALEEQQADLKRELQANAEVEKLLHERGA